MAETEFFTIGQIVAPHGVRGDVRVYPDTDFPERFLTTDARFHKRVVLMKFVGIHDRNGVEPLLHKELQVTRQDLMPLEEGQHYVFDIIGCRVFDKENNVLGTVTDILKTGSNDVYVVTDEDGKELLLAVIPQVILSVNTDTKTIIADPPEWTE